MVSALNARSVRASILAENLANGDVPGYLPRDIDFKRMLERVAEDLSSGADTPKDLGAVRVAPENVRADSSGVDVSRELGEVFDNSLAYVATMKLFGDMMNRLKTAYS
jgi:flagellar basal-body rod protein FlgB